MSSMGPTWDKTQWPDKTLQSKQISIELNKNLENGVTNDSDCSRLSWKTFSKSLKL